MRHLLLTGFLCCSLFLPAQKKVSVVMAGYRHTMDSMMRVTYGDSLFEKYFVFDTNSFIWVDHNAMFSWNQSYTGDSITGIEFWYNFVYPGARISPVDAYRPTSTIMWVFEDSLTYHGRCMTVEPNRVRKLTRRKMHRRLNRCYVNLYTEDYFFVNDYNIRYLDSSHVYLEVNYARDWGGAHRGDRFWSWHKSIVIDACTGEYIGKDRMFFSGRRGYF